MMTQSFVHLSAGRESINEQMQALCFMGGADSIFYGCKLLTTSNPETQEDVMLFNKLGINSKQTKDYSDEAFAAALTDEITQKQNASLYVDASAKTSKPSAETKIMDEKTMDKKIKTQTEQLIS